MPTKMALWRINSDKPQPINTAKLDLESRLEEWVEDDPSILGIDIMLIGRQVPTAFGGFVDFLALDASGKLIVIELKRDRTPREVVAQALDYASWARTLTPKDVYLIAEDYLGDGLDLDSAFLDAFERQLPESLNSEHEMLIVASELDDSSERIIEYLVEEYGVGINGVFFSFYSDGQSEYLGRSWLASPDSVAKTSTSRRKTPWTGFWYVNVDEGETRSWDDWRKYGIVSAGGGRKYSSALERLSIGDRLFAYQKGMGYVGYGEVTSNTPVMAKDFVVQGLGSPLLELPLKQPRLDQHRDDPEMAEWVLGVKWLKSFDMSEAKKFPGIFANQNVVCKLRDEKTFAFLKEQFGIADDDGSSVSHDAREDRHVPADAR
jgi:hypothetical protein